MQSALGKLDLSALRDRAEGLLRTTRRDVSTLSVAGIQHLVHELQVHQIELEMQNEELRERTRELEESRGQYQSLYEFAPTGYLDLDSSGVIRQANLAAATLLGPDRQELVGTPLSAFVDEKDIITLHEHLRNTARSERATGELRLTSGKAGSPTYVLLVTSCDAAPTAGYLMALMDVTDRRRAQDALRAANEELEAHVAERTRALAEQNEKLAQELVARAASEEERGVLEKRLRDAERLESLGLLAGGVAHDFNNLLVGVLGTADLLLQEEMLPDNVRESLGVIKRAARGATDLTRQMLMYAGRSLAQLEPLDLHSAIKDCVELVGPSLPPLAQVRAELGDSVPLIEADRGQLRQVIANLLNNAVEALGGSAGAVVVRTRVLDLDGEGLARYAHAPAAKAGRFVVLEVRDNGPGMENATLSRVFDPFFSTKATGRGLGLASVLGIVQAHHGAVRARSTLRQGTTFEIAWPVSTRPTMARPSSIPVVPGLESGRVLVIDDDETVLRGVARQLSFLGFEPTTAGAGAEGLTMFRDANPPFALVVLDRTMPGLSGDQVLVLLREVDPTIPVVLMSGWSVDELQLPADTVTFLQKPMTLTDLTGAIRQVLAARPTLSAAR